MDHVLEGVYAYSDINKNATLTTLQDKVLTISADKNTDGLIQVSFNGVNIDDTVVELQAMNGVIAKIDGIMDPNYVKPTPALTPTDAPT